MSDGSLTGYEDEFRRLFAREAEPRLAALARHAAALLDAPGDAEALAGLLGEAHLLKGSAAVVGYADVAGELHLLESRLRSLQAAAVGPDGATARELVVMVEGVRALVARAVNGPTARLRAVLVEDSLLQRTHLLRLLELEGDIEVVAQAADAPGAVDAVARHAPDVVTMDLDLPGGGGQLAIEEIMAATPTPILVLSGIIEGPQALPAVRALAAGAVHALPKPLRWTAAEERELREAVRTAASVEVAAAGTAAETPEREPRLGNARIIAVGASTGGPAALTALLGALGDIPAPVLVVQHIHAAFADGFAAWLAAEIGRPVELVRGSARPGPGGVYVAPGDAHLLLGADGALHTTPEPEGPYRPSVDMLLGSVAEHAGSAGVGVVLTGMGDDGAAGLLALRRAGGRTFAQDEASSTVFSMPRAAHAAGAVEMLLPPSRIAVAVAAAVGVEVGGRR